MNEDYQKMLIAMNKCASAQLDLAEIAHELSRLLDAERTGYSLGIPTLDVLKTFAASAEVRAIEIREFLNEKIGKILNERERRREEED